MDAKTRVTLGEIRLETEAGLLCLPTIDEIREAMTDPATVLELQNSLTAVREALGAIQRRADEALGHSG
jgi:hypothetical protein